MLKNDNTKETATKLIIINAFKSRNDENEIKTEYLSNSNTYERLQGTYRKLSI